MKRRRYEDQVPLSRFHDIHVQGSLNIMQKEGLPGLQLSLSLSLPGLAGKVKAGRNTKGAVSPTISCNIHSSSKSSLSGGGALAFRTCMSEKQSTAAGECNKGALKTLLNLAHLGDE